MRGACAILVPLVNSYKRLVSATKPWSILLARINRSALDPCARGVQDRRRYPASNCAAPIRSCNPHLAFAV